MKLLLDANLSDRMAGRLADLYPGTVHVKQIGLQNAPDEAIWEHAKNNGYVLASKDWDFHQMSLVHGYPPKVVYLHVGNCATKTLLELLRENFDEMAAFERDSVESLLVLSK